MISAVESLIESIAFLFVFIGLLVYIERFKKGGG